MYKKITAALVAVGLLIGAAGLSAKEKAATDEKQTQDTLKEDQTARRPLGPGGMRMLHHFNQWLDQLKKAHEENDTEKVGKLIEKMDQRREEIRQKVKQWRERRKESGRGTRPFRNMRRDRTPRGRAWVERGYGPGRGFDRMHRGRGRQGYGGYGYRRHGTQAPVPSGPPRGYGRQWKGPQSRRPPQYAPRQGYRYYGPWWQQTPEDESDFDWDW